MGLADLSALPELTQWCILDSAKIAHIFMMLLTTTTFIIIIKKKPQLNNTLIYVFSTFESVPIQIINTLIRQKMQ